MWRGALAIVGSFDDDLVSWRWPGRSRALLPRIGSSKRLSHSSTARLLVMTKLDAPVPVEDKFIQIGGLLGVEPVQPQVVADEQVWRQEGPEAGAHRVVDPGPGHGFEEVISVG